MRQAGVLAAAGIVALETMVERLGEDHDRARRLAKGLAAIPGLVLAPGTPVTNMVFLSLDASVPFSTREVVEKLGARGVLVGVSGSRQFRLVTHYWVDDAGVERAVEAFKSILA